MKKHHAKKWLSDDRNNGAPPKEDLAWVNSNLQNDIATADWKFWAVVRPKSVTAQMNMDASMEKAGEKNQE